MAQPRLEQIAQDGATAGQLARWDNGDGEWQPDDFLHAASHIKDGTDEIDGDTIDIDFTPTNYTPSTTPAEATSVDHLTAHLAGIDNGLASSNAAIQLNPGEAIVDGGSVGASKVVANDYAATEHNASKSSFAVYSRYMPRTPSADVTIKVKFIIKTAGTGSNIRIGTKIKARATGEDTSAVLDDIQVSVVPITFTTIGEIFETSLTIPQATFADNDAVAFHVGRDGAEVIAGGAADDVNKAIQIIAIEVVIP